VMFSGGAASWYTAKRVRDTILNGDSSNMLLLFADTKTEDEDLYRFIKEAADDIGCSYLCLADGRDIWQIFNDVKFLGNSMIDPCSRILKRQLIKSWLYRNMHPDTTEIYIGMDYSEGQRFERAKNFWGKWRIHAPLLDKPYMDKNAMFAEMEQAGIDVPRLYEMGFPHNNCGGFCVKAGKSQFKLLWEKMPDRYAYHERKEQEIRKVLGEVTVVKESRKGVSTPITLRDLRLRWEKDMDKDEDLFEWGGCACFTP